MGESSVKKTAMPKLTGTAIKSAMSEVVKVPTIIAKPPYLSPTGSHCAVHMKLGPYSRIAGHAPTASEAMMPARRPKVSKAAPCAATEKARSPQGARRRRCTGLASCAGVFMGVAAFVLFERH